MLPQFANRDLKYYTLKALGDCIIGDNLNKPSTRQSEQLTTKPTFLVHKELTTFLFNDFENSIPLNRVELLTNYFTSNKWV